VIVSQQHELHPRLTPTDHAGFALLEKNMKKEKVYLLHINRYALEGIASIGKRASKLTALNEIKIEITYLLLTIYFLHEMIQFQFCSFLVK